MWSLVLATPLVAPEPDRSSTVWALVALLVVLGVALVMLAVWLLRATRVDPDVLAPLERMSDRSWRRADPVHQRRELDDLRPEGAEPLERMAAPPVPDAAFDAGPQAPGFDDLRDAVEPVGVGDTVGDTDRATDAVFGAPDDASAVRRDGVDADVADDDADAGAGPRAQDDDDGRAHSSDAGSDVEDEHAPVGAPEARLADADVAADADADAVDPDGVDGESDSELWPSDGRV